MGRKRTGKQDHSDYSFEAIIIAACSIPSTTRTPNMQRVLPHTESSWSEHSPRFAEAVRQESLAVIIPQPPLPLGIWHDDGLSTARNKRTMR